MTDENTHQAVVAAWLRRAPGGPDELVRTFEDTFAALWRRSQLTLGDVTLTAIVDRVLHLAGEKFPALGSIALGETGLSWPEAPAGADPARLAEGISFVLVEFLTVLGNLTAEILTPALHAELSGQPASSSSHPTHEDPTS